jgi:uncharacterized protein (DUF1330 family)
MPAYVVVSVEVTYPEAYRDYSREVPGTLEPYGGRFVVRGGTFEALEGAWPSGRVVILEFPSVGQAKAWHASPEYQEILPIRQRNARTDFLIVVEGYDPAS